jgi:mono/diheme cytochrome c family protein
MARRFLLPVVILLAGPGLANLLGQQEPPTGSSNERRATAAVQGDLLKRYCSACHNERLKTGGFALEAVDISNVGAHPTVWEKVVQKLRGGQMPPLGRPRPSPAAYQGLASWLESELDRAAAAAPNPGRAATLHLLNRTEYRNSIRDLLGLDVDVSGLLPPDDSSYGFDNIAGVVKINPSRMERYLGAARKISHLAIGGSVAPAIETFTVPPDFPQYDRVEGLPFGTRGGTLISYVFPQDGDYTFEVKLLCPASYSGDENCDGAGGFPERHELDIFLDGKRVQRFVLEPRQLRDRFTSGAGGTLDDLQLDRYQVRVAVKAGQRDVGAAFVASPNQEFVLPGYRMRFERPYTHPAGFEEMAVSVPFVHKVMIAGPYEPAGSGDTISRRAIFVCRPTRPTGEAECARTILRTLARRAYRRAVTDADVRELLAFYERGRAEGGGFEAGIEWALQALLASPDFLFRIQQQPGSVAPNQIYRLTDVELASRLSFFLWSSIPDEELLTVAIAGRLKEPEVLRQQVKRMLASTKAAALTTSFAAQWLELRNLQGVQPLRPLFPNFDESLRAAFKRETELFVESIVREDRSVVELLTANYTFMNERLARHYGRRGIQGSDFRRVELSQEDPRRGLLGQGSILTITSYANRTSPVRRGKWILDNILGTPPPPPPANVPALPDKKAGAIVPHTVRELMEEHRKNPVCATCHSIMDPAGFALENFDAIGRYRTIDRDTYTQLDTSGTLPDGSAFKTLTEFKALLAKDPERFVTTLTTKLLTYAIGRGVEASDMPAVRQIVRLSAQDEHRMSSLVLRIVESLPFQMRRAAEKPEAPTIAAR